MVRLGVGSYLTSGLYRDVETQFYLASGGFLLSFKYSNNIRFNFSFTGGVVANEKILDDNLTSCVTICSSMELTSNNNSPLHFEIYGPSLTTLGDGLSMGIIGVIVGYKFE